MCWYVNKIYVVLVYKQICLIVCTVSCKYVYVRGRGIYLLFWTRCSSRGRYTITVRGWSILFGCFELVGYNNLK